MYKNPSESAFPASSNASKNLSALIPSVSVALTAIVPTDEKVALSNLNTPLPGLLPVFVLVENVNGTPPLKPTPEDP